MRRRLLMAIVNAFKWLKEKFVYIYNSIIPNKIATFNKWDEVWELGYIDNTTGQNVNGSTTIRSTNYVSVLPNTTYYMKISNGTNLYAYDRNKNFISMFGTFNNQTFTTPQGCYYIRFRAGTGYGTTYNHDICINVSDPNKNGIYVPYSPYKVLDKSRIAKIEGNSEVVNQYAQEINSSNYNLTPTQETNGSITFNNGEVEYAVSNVGTTYNFGFKSSYQVGIIGHKYLFMLLAKANKTGIEIRTDLFNMSNALSGTLGTSYSMLYVIKNATYDDRPFYIFTYSGTSVGDTITFKNIQLIDLTQEFGSGNEPTSINDPRVQRIIAKGHIPFNTGEIQNSIVGEIEGEGFNIWNEEWGNYYWDEGDGGVRKSNSSSFGCVDYIKVIPNTTYNLHSGSGGTFYVLCYDKNKNLLSYSMGYQRTFTTPNNCFYITFYSYQTYGTTYKNDICINISNTELNGTYKPHIANQFIRLPQPLELESAGLVHNTFEITQTEYVFTRNVFKVDLGSLNWTKENDHFYSENIALAYVVANNNIVANILCEKYVAYSYATIIQDTTIGISLNNSKRLYVYDSSLSSGDAQSFKSAMSSVYLNFELATPQVIRIPKKHFGAVKLKDLTWGITTYDRFYATVSNIKVSTTRTLGVYTPKYLCKMGGEAFDQNWNMVIYIGGSNTQVYIHDKRFNNTNDFKASLTDNDILFYETENEVEDFNNELECQSGGILNANLFSWVKNQIIVNGNFVDTTNWDVNTNYGSISVANNQLTYTISTVGTNLQNRINSRDCDLTLNHKYLYSFYIKSVGKNQDAIRIYAQDCFNVICGNLTADVETHFTGIMTSNSTNTRNVSILLGDDLKAVNDVYVLKEVQLIDLTKGFGVGNEPTDINDYRIKRILELGYIPTDIVGTDTGEIVDTLPNVEMAFKCKK